MFFQYYFTLYIIEIYILGKCAKNQFFYPLKKIRFL